MSRRCPEGIPTIFTGLKRKSRWESVAVEGMARVKEPRSFLDCGTSSLRLGCWVLNCIGLDGVGRKRGRGEEGMGREPSVRMTPGLLKCRGSLSWDTGAGWSNRAGKVAYESRRDYIIAVKGKIRLRVTLSTQSESAAFRRISLISSSGDLWCGVVHDGVIRPFGGVGNGTRGCGYWLGGV